MSAKNIPSLSKEEKLVLKEHPEFGVSYVHGCWVFSQKIMTASVLERFSMAFRDTSVILSVLISFLVSLEIPICAVSLVLFGRVEPEIFNAHPALWWFWLSCATLSMLVTFDRFSKYNLDEFGIALCYLPSLVLLVSFLIVNNI